MPQISKLCLTGSRSRLLRVSHSPALLWLSRSFHKLVLVITHHYCQQVEGDTQSCSLKPKYSNPGLLDSLQVTVPALSPIPAVLSSPKCCCFFEVSCCCWLCQDLGLTPCHGNFSPSAHPKYPWCKHLPICTGDEAASLWPSSV